MSELKTNISKSIFLAALAIVLPVLSLFYYSHVNAADLVQRSVRIGSSVASEITSHEFRFTTATNASVGSLLFEYCSNLPLYGSPCTAPAGLVVNSSSILTQTGLTGFSLHGSSNANRLVITRAAAVSAPTIANFVFNNITNPSGVNQTVFVRISTHASTDASGVPIDFGAVVFSTVPGVGVGGFVPPYLTFCVGVTVASDCSSATGDIIALGELSSVNSTTATSQFAVATNDPVGYNAYISGGTMAAGNEVIPNLISGTASAVGTSQFGINLRSNSSPSVGANVSGSGTGNPSSNYGTSNIFRYNSGDQIASSPLPTEFNRFTVSYVVNVSRSQKPGIYASSFNFTAVVAF